MTRRGLTLVEVIIAIAVLAIGILAALALQSNALRASSTARAIQEVTKIADAELVVRRQGGTGTGCLTAAPAGYTCTLVVQPCQVVSGAFSCGSGSAAQLLTLTVAGPRDQSITVSTLVLP